MARGGARPGAGRPRKPLADKVLEGNAGKRELTVLAFENQTENQRKESKKSKINQKNSKMPTYLDMIAKEGGDDLPPASDIYSMLEGFIESAGCTEFVAANLIEDFAFLRRAYLECEYMNRKLGRIASGRRSPYVNMALDYQKAMMTVWSQIWLIISRNCEEPYEGKNAFLEMLKGRGF